MYRDGCSGSGSGSGGREEPPRDVEPFAGGVPTGGMGVCMCMFAGGMCMCIYYMRNTDGHDIDAHTHDAGGM